MEANMDETSIPPATPSVGYGHLCSNSRCPDVKYSIPLYKADGKKLLAYGNEAKGEVPCRYAQKQGSRQY